jgi:cell division septum initiation protein DivIVA
MSVVRYNFMNDYHHCGCGEVEDDSGEYVEYADYQKLLDENDQLRAEIDRLRRMLVGYVNHVSEFEGIDYLDRESECLTQSERQEIAQMVDAAFNKDAKEDA